MKKKYSIWLLSMLLMLSLLAGCGEHEATTPENFIGLMKEMGFSVKDSIDQFEDYEYVKRAYLAQSPDGTYQVEFYELDSVEGACTFYLENYNILSKNEETAQSHVSTSTETRQNYEITGQAGFGCVTRIGATCFFAVVDKEYADEVKEIRDALGY